MSCRKCIFPFIFLTAVIFLAARFSGCYAQTYIRNTYGSTYLTNLFILESEYRPGKYIEGSNPGFTPYGGGRLPVTLRTARRMYTFKGYIIPDLSLSNVLLSLYLGPSSYPYDVYVNGKKVLSRGSRDKDYQSTSYDTVKAELYPDLLRQGNSADEITIQAFPLEETAPLETPIISSYEYVSQLVFFRNLFNVHFIQASFIIGLLIGIYFIFHFAARGFHDRHYLYFAVLCFFFSFCYFNISFNYNLADQVLLEKVSRTSFPMACLFLTLFVRELTGIAKRLWVMVLISVPSIILSLIIISKTSFIEIDNFFNSTVMLYLIPPLLVFSFVMLIISFFRTWKKNYLVIMLGFILVFSASVHDITYIILSSNPFCWFVPYGYLALLISIFVVLALEESAMYKESQKRSSDIDGKNSSMKRIIDRIETVSRNLVHSSRSLEDNIGKAANVIRNSSRNTKIITDRLLTQLRTIENVTKDIALRIETALEKIPRAISNQTAAVEETNRTVSSMNNHIDNILRSSSKTNDITQDLSKIASSVRDIVMKSKGSIAQVSENSRFISEILTNIQDIVEESNFLSINASIESAHAGAAGKGFSILANEIRELANKSRERLLMSQDRLNQMIDFINESMTLSEEVTSQLLSIIEKSETSADMINKINELLSEHKMEAGDILRGSGTLLEDTLSIKRMTEEDSEGNISLRDVLSNLKDSFIDLSGLLKAQAESGENIRAAMDSIQEVLNDNLKVMGMLKESVSIAGRSD